MRGYIFNKGDWEFPQKGGTYISFRCLQDFGQLEYVTLQNCKDL